MTIADKPDIVKRLRDDDRGWIHPAVAAEAADEIEQLVRLCRALARQQRESEDAYGMAAVAIEHLTAHRESLLAIIARQALEIAQLRREQ